MKLKLGLAFAAAMFAGSFTLTAKAYDWSEFQQCTRDCRTTYRLCLQNSPAQLCNDFHRQCLADCGVFD